ncbi:MAG TPA: hypothetical protein VFV98_16030 [Vicinamibacterales bacterium]|nr:hypothetical protein [Vicinamibacterales bacterium]
MFGRSVLSFLDAQFSELSTNERQNRTPEPPNERTYSGCAAAGGQERVIYTVELASGKMTRLSR